MRYKLQSLIIVFFGIFNIVEINSQGITVTDNKGTIKNINKVSYGNLPPSAITIPPIPNPNKGNLIGDYYIRGTYINPKEIYIYDGNNWVSTNNFWSLKGNTNTNTNFLGTTNPNPLIFKTNGIEHMRIDENKGHLMINSINTYSNTPLIIKAEQQYKELIAFQNSAAGITRWQMEMSSDNNFTLLEVNHPTNANIGNISRLTMKTGGDLGIGLTNPTEKLDINGKLKIRNIEDKTINGLSVGDKIVIIDATGVVKKIQGTFHVIGDVKHSVKTSDHNGWYLLDGRLVTSLNPRAIANANSLVGVIQSGRIPNAINRVLKHPKKGQQHLITGGNGLTKLIQDNLPNVNFLGTTNFTGEHNHNYSNTPNHLRVIASLTNNGNSNRVIVNTPVNSITTMGGSHDHTVIVNSGGKEAVFSNYPPYLTVNTFIYLGE